MTLSKARWFFVRSLLTKREKDVLLYSCASAWKNCYKAKVSEETKDEYQEIGSALEGDQLKFTVRTIVG